MENKETENLNALISKFEIGDYNQSIALGQKFTKDFPQNGTGWNVLGLSLKANGDLEEAIKIFKFLIKVLPKNAAYVANLGNSYMLVGRIQEGIRSLKKAISLEPKLVNAIEALGLAYTEIGREKDAARLFAQVIKLDSSNQRSPYYLGNLYLNDKNWAEAEKYLRISQFGLSQSHILECLLCLDKRQEFKFHYKKLTESGVRNPLIGGLISHAKELYGGEIDNNFCNDPIDFIFVDRIEETDGLTKEVMEKLIAYHYSRKNSYRGQNLLHNGAQSSGNIFLTDEPFVKGLKLAIESKITRYRKIYANRNEGFLSHWPDKYDLFGWMVSMKSGGKLDAHNHKEGWLSGSLYLSLPDKKDKKNIDGNIAFSNVGPRYPVIDTPIAKKVVDINERDICLFPSSLFHETIPFSSEKERISFAFDVIPRG